MFTAVKAPIDANADRILSIDADAGFVREAEKYLPHATDEEKISLIERLEMIALDYHQGGVPGWASRVLDEADYG